MVLKIMIVHLFLEVGIITISQTSNTKNSIA
jgi:hypothetical protein